MSNAQNEDKAPLPPSLAARFLSLSPRLSLPVAVAAAAEAARGGRVFMAAFLSFRSSFLLLLAAALLLPFCVVVLLQAITLKVLFCGGGREGGGWWGLVARELLCGWARAPLLARSRSLSPVPPCVPLLLASRSHRTLSLHPAPSPPALSLSLFVRTRAKTRVII